MAISRRRFTLGALAGLAGALPDRLLAFRARPKLTVFLIAEQFRQVYLDRAEGLLSPGGFHELMSRGIYYPNCHFSSSGFTASGLATLATGAYPQVHGIVADQWWDRRIRTPAKARAELLEATTLADEVAHSGRDEMTHSPRSRVFCMGMQEGTTSLLAGNSQGQVFWMDSQGKFNTRGNVPEWLNVYNASRSIENFHDSKWTAMGAGLETPPLRTLNFDPKRPEDFLALYQSSPYCQNAQFELLHALFTAEKLGQGDTLDFVFLSLGSLALLGYETGSDSALMQQMVLHLDRLIQHLLEVLNQAPGKDKFNLIFAAAHGAPPNPDPAMRSRKAIFGETIAHAIERGLSEWFDKPPAKNSYVDKYIYPFLYLKPEILRKQTIAPRVARRVAGEVALRQQGVAGYYTADGDCSHTGEWRRRFENSFNELRSGDVMLSYDPEAVEDYGLARGISYGSLYDYDTRVPLLLYGPPFGKKLIERAIDAVDLAPTVARAAGISPPSSSTGDVLAEAFADTPEDEHPK